MITSDSFARSIAQGVPTPSSPPDVEARVVTATGAVPLCLQARLGDTVLMRVTNPATHAGDYRGFGVVDYGINEVIPPGATREIRFVARRPGRFPLYSSGFAPAFDADESGELEVLTAAAPAP